jgi:hypothetical protein
MITLLKKSYDGESIVDIERDVAEALENSSIPQDQYGIQAGTFTITLEWEPV